jgi:hypothetical protein
LSRDYVPLLPSTSITMSALLKLLIIFALSSVKFLLAPALSFGLGFNFLQTLASTSAGGIMGVFVFFYFSRWLINLYDSYLRKAVHKAIHRLADRLNISHLAERFFPYTIKKRKVFTFTNKLYVRIRRKYGLIGIIIVTPVLLSIPIGSFLLARFYPKRNYIVLYLSASVVMWSLIMSSAIAVF